MDEEVAFAIRYHQVLRFYPDESVGHAYPEPYVEREYQYARTHKHYMSARLITINDLYAFDPDLLRSTGSVLDISSLGVKSRQN